MKIPAAVLVLSLATAAPLCAQIPEMQGTWLLNPAKSIGPSPAWERIVYTIVPGEQRYVMDARNADGRTSRVEWAAKYDGRDHPTSSGTPGTTTSLRRLDVKTELVTNKRDGVVTGTYTRVLVDDDGTIMSIGRDPKGKIQWVRVFERQ